MTRMKEQRTTTGASVGSPSKQAGDNHDRWAWVERSVWTPRMLDALDRGVKGGMWFSLIDKVYSEANLRSAFAQVKRNKGAAGVDHVSIASFERNLDRHIAATHEQLRGGNYTPQAVRRVYIPKPGSKELRGLGIPTVLDRTVQGALRATIEPIFERDFADTSFGFRPGRGCKDALRRVQALLHEGFVYVVDADLRRYFDTIPHDRLLERLREKISDSRVIDLVTLFLKQGIMEGTEELEPEEGTPQGAVISPLLANIYLNPLDHLMAELGFKMTRYADDFVIMCRSRAEAETALALVQEWTRAEGLTLHPEKTRIVDARERGGFDFLGYHFERGHRWPRKKSLEKINARIRELTPRCSGKSIEETIRRLNSVLRGWFEYFKHSVANIFEKLDKHIRMRLRSILRKRQKRKGRGRGRDHNRWPNAYFDALGLFSLFGARKAAVQSARR